MYWHTFKEFHDSQQQMGLYYIDGAKTQSLLQKLIIVGSSIKTATEELQLIHLFLRIN